jgi:hypothetical protein
LASKYILFKGLQVPYMAQNGPKILGGGGSGKNRGESVCTKGLYYVVNNITIKIQC